MSLQPPLGRTPLQSRSPGSHLFSGFGSNVLRPLALGTATPVPRAGIGGLQLPAATWSVGRAARSPCSLRRERAWGLELGTQWLLNEGKTPGERRRRPWEAGLAAKMHRDGQKTFSREEQPRAPRSTNPAVRVQACISRTVDNTHAQD